LRLGFSFDLAKKKKKVVGQGRFAPVLKIYLEITFAMRRKWTDEGPGGFNTMAMMMEVGGGYFIMLIG
jgi:hypothetical protein